MAKRGRKPHPRHLADSDRAWFRERIAREVRRWKGRPETIEVAGNVIDELWDELWDRVAGFVPAGVLADEDVERLIRVIPALAIEGAGDHHARKVIDEMAKLHAFTTGGQKVALPALVGTPELRVSPAEDEPDGVSVERKMVQVHILDLVWGELRAKRAVWQAVADSAGLWLLTIDYLLGFEALYPTATTPREALAMAGIDPDTVIDLSTLSVTA